MNYNIFCSCIKNHQFKCDCNLKNKNTLSVNKINTKLLHEIFVSCVDMTISLIDKSNKSKQHINIGYTDDIVLAAKCMKSKKSECNKYTDDCRLSTGSSKKCLVKDTKLNKQNKDLSFSNDDNIKDLNIQTFKFNSTYDGKIIELIKIIPFNISKKDGGEYKSYVFVYKIDKIICICFPTGYIVDVTSFSFFLNEKKDMQDLISELFIEDKNYLICGHSMGGALSQYICGLDWGEKNDYKKKSYLITSGAFKCLNDAQKSSIETNFKNRYWNYCSLRYNMSKDSLLFDKFVMDYKNANDKSLNLQLLCFNVNYNDNEFDYEFQFSIKNFDTNDKKDEYDVNINNKKIIFKKSESNFWIDLIHDWSTSYRPFIIILLEKTGNNNFSNIGGTKKRKYKNKNKKRILTISKKRF